MKPVTAWYKYLPSLQIWDFNHIEDGHSTENHPTKFPLRFPGQWAAYHRWLTDDVPPKLVAYSPEERDYV